MRVQQSMNKVKVIRKIAETEVEKDDYKSGGCQSTQQQKGLRSEVVYFSSDSPGASWVACSRSVAGRSSLCRMRYQGWSLLLPFLSQEVQSQDC